MDDEQYVALVEELERMVDAAEAARGPQAVRFMREDMWQEPGLVAYQLLYDDAVDAHRLPDAEVARIWEIGYALGYSAEFLFPDDSLEDARPERRTRPPQPVRHPLAGGGHGPGRGLPGKREFPSTWDDDTVVAHTMDTARRPTVGTRLPQGTYRAGGERDGVVLAVLLSPEGDVLTSYPVTGPGVRTNPLDDLRRPLVERLRRALDATVPADHPSRGDLEELLDVGEWPHVLRALDALGAEQADLADLRAAAGLPPAPSG